MYPLYIMSELNTSISAPMDSTGYKSISSLEVSRVSIQPENRSSLNLVGSNTSDVYFSIPSRNHAFLNGSNSYLSFTYTYTGTTETAGIEVQVSNGTGANFLKNHRSKMILLKRVVSNSTNPIHIISKGLHHQKNSSNRYSSTSLFLCRS